MREGVPLFRKLLWDGDPEIEAQAAKLLAWFPSEADGSLEALWARLEKAPQRVAGACLAAIGLLGGRHQVERLAPLLTDDDPWRRWGAAIALARIAGREAPDPTLDVLVDAATGDLPDGTDDGVEFDNGDMPGYAIRSLRLLGPRGLDAMLEALPGCERLVHGVVPHVFPERVDAPFAELTDDQQRVLREVLRSGWVVGLAAAQPGSAGRRRRRSTPTSAASSRGGGGSGSAAERAVRSRLQMKFIKQRSLGDEADAARGAAEVPHARAAREVRREHAPGRGGPGAVAGRLGRQQGARGRAAGARRTGRALPVRRRDGRLRHAGRDRAADGREGRIGAHRELRAKRKGDFKNTVKQSFNVSPVPQSADPSIPGSERAARDAARAPYVSPTAVEVRIDRIATRGETQLAEVLARPVAPERTFGVYRVPDRISGPLTPHSEKRRVVEWDIVHSPGAAPGVPLAATSFVAEEHWVARRPGEPSVLDEDLALAFCLEAGIGPERCAGLAADLRVPHARRLERRRDGRRHGHDRARDRGAASGSAARVHSSACGRRLRSRSARPKASTSRCSTGARWRLRCTPRSITRRPSPSPFPYLPATPQELLRSYLEVVGVQPADCYSAQATVDRPRSLVQGGFLTTNLGPKQPCADGEHRMRTRGCEHVVIVYRDRAEYAEGRARWAAYQAEVLEADLSKGLGLRRTIAVPDTGFLSKVDRAAGFVERLHPDHWGELGPGGVAAAPLLLAAGLSLWSDGDVTPSGRPPGEGAPAAPPQPVYSGGDPFGARPTRRERGWGRLGLGVILIVAGFVAIGFGIVAAVGARDQIESDAVARGLSGEPFGFTAAEPDDYTVFLVNAFGGTDAQERAVARTSCTVSFPVGGTQFSGSSQGFSLTLGSASSIGHFDAPAGAVGLLCTGTGSGELVVTPGRPGIGTAIAGIVGGAFAILAGIALVLLGR